MQFYREQFEKNRVKEPLWLASVREMAMGRFLELGLPTVKQEEWKYTSVESLRKIDFRLAELNGGFDREASSWGELPKGVIISSLAEVLRTQPKLVESYLGKLADFQKQGFVAWNTAFFADGAFVYLPKGVVLEKPVQLVFRSSSNDQTVSHPRNLIIAEEGSQATIVESYVGKGSEQTLTNAVTEVHAAPGAVLEHCKIQDESACHVGRVQVRQGRDSRYMNHAVILRGKLVRNDLETILNDEGADCLLNGFFMVGGSDHVDNHTSIDHAKPHGTSQEIYKGILAGKATGVFDGKIIVRPNAQKTSARQINKNLVLSDDAIMNTRPLLEIFANDVKCNHGATIGRLDENQIFYLRARGISLQDAKRLLTGAFANDVLAGVRAEPLRNYLRSKIEERLLGGLL